MRHYWLRRYFPAVSLAVLAVAITVAVVLGAVILNHPHG